MIIFPAIDIKNGECVRLQKGLFETASKVYSSPFDAAGFFVECGADHIHLVDLDGSLAGRPVNGDIICKIKNSSNVFCEVGGGIRTIEHIKYYIDNGVDRIILGTAALENIEFLKRCIDLFGNRISVSIDALDGKVKTNGWTVSSEENYIDFAKKLENAGLTNIIFTDISKDGLLTGPNFESLGNLLNEVRIDITASGGIKDIGHIEKLKKMGIYGAICGKSIYSGTLDLKKALKVSGD